MENKDFKEKNEFRTGENGVRNFRIPVILQDREHGFENWRKKWIRTRFAQGSHSCEIRTRDFWKGPRACIFWKLAQKHFRTRDVSWENFAQQEVLCENGWVLVFSPLLSLVFTMTSFFKLSYLNVNTKKTNSKHIRTTLKLKIKIKTWKNTRKTLD